MGLQKPPKPAAGLTGRETELNKGTRRTNGVHCNACGNGARASMDGKGRCVDNVFVERLWRSVKYQDIFLHAYQTMRDLNAALARYFDFYNARRPHQSLEYRTPDEMYFGADKMTKAA